MKRVLFFALMVVSALSVMAQGMTDQQVADFVRREMKAGASQAQIVTRLVQRGVPIDQIRRIRNQADARITESGVDANVSGTGNQVSERLRQNTDGATNQELNTAKVGTTGEIYADASEDISEVEHDIQATSNVTEATGKKIFGHDIFNRRNLSFEPNMNIATPQNYVLGPGDQLIVDIYGASQKSMQLTISPDGEVTVPGYGPIYVSGMTVAAANSKIR